MWDNHTFLPMIDGPHRFNKDLCKEKICTMMEKDANGLAALIFSAAESETVRLNNLTSAPMTSSSNTKISSTCSDASGANISKLY